MLNPRGAFPFPLLSQGAFPFPFPSPPKPPIQLQLGLSVYYILNPPLQLATEKGKTAPTALENTAQGVLCARNHCSAVLRSHWPLEIAARACRGATWRSKSPLEHAFSCSATLANAAPALALGASARASVVGFDNTFAFPAESLSKSIAKSLCFELCIASSCALRDSTGTVRCHMRI